MQRLERLCAILSCARTSGPPDAMIPFIVVFVIGFLFVVTSRYLEPASSEAIIAKIQAVYPQADRDGAIGGGAALNDEQVARDLPHRPLMIAAVVTLLICMTVAFLGTLRIIARCACASRRRKFWFTMAVAFPFILAVLVGDAYVNQRTRWDQLAFHTLNMIELRPKSNLSGYHLAGMLNTIAAFVVGLLVVATGAVLAQPAEQVEDKVRDLYERTAMLEQLFHMAITILVAGVCELSLFAVWPYLLTEDPLLKRMAFSLPIATGILASAFIMVTWMSVAMVLRSRAYDLAEEQVPSGDFMEQRKWVRRYRFDSSPASKFRQLMTGLSPLLAGTTLPSIIQFLSSSASVGGSP